MELSHKKIKNRQNRKNRILNHSKIEHIQIYSLKKNKKLLTALISKKVKFLSLLLLKQLTFQGIHLATLKSMKISS